MKGAYLVVMKLDKDTLIQIGKRKVLGFTKGYYVYVGSALQGLNQRIRRHLRYEKKTHWHIDYLRPYTEVVAIFYKENIVKEECTIAQALQEYFGSIPGFGCSDCSCESHLFFGSSQEISQVACALGMKPYRLEANP
ncbi:MAG: endonuclease [Thermoplasmata archaeon M11B2D]|nr:MAG: endonuclease [Thermoplasmata archaeon M11B2D]PNX53668.1 MAG: endonuclease [Thermoplasmata archaeon M9B2D]